MHTPEFPKTVEIDLRDVASTKAILLNRVHGRSRQDYLLPVEIQILPAAQHKRTRS